MKSLYLSLLVASSLAGCSAASTKSPDVSDGIRKSLAEARFVDVSVAQDRDKGVVTLGGHVSADSDKERAESIARSIAGGQVVANEIAVHPLGQEQDAKDLALALDSGIEHNLDAALIQNDLREGVKYSVRTGVVTLTGEVGSQERRGRAERMASGVPNVQQVVNELQVKDQKATSR